MSASEHVRSASDSAYQRWQATTACFGRSQSGGGTQQLSSTPTWPALAAASLTSVHGQRGLCIILPDLAAYAREGDDLGGAQRLAVMEVDFGWWSQRTSAGGAQPCGWQAELRPRQSHQSDLDAEDRQRLAAAPSRLGQPGSWRKRVEEDRGE